MRIQDSMILTSVNFNDFCGLTVDSDGYSGTPLIVIDANGLAATGIQLGAGADGSTVRGLVLRDFTGNAIQIDAGSDGNTIAGNYIGSFGAAGLDLGSNKTNLGAGGVAGAGSLLKKTP